MDQETLELYLYIGSAEPIIKWLKEEGCKTQKQAIEKLKPLIRNNLYSFAAMVGSGEFNGSLAGTSNAANQIIKSFPENEIF